MKRDQSNFVCSWSGGKDSCYAFYKAMQMGYKPKVLLNVMNEEGKRSRSHGISKEILEAQAVSIGMPIQFFNSSWDDYEENFIKHLSDLTQTFGLTHGVYGDIDILSHKDWEVKVSRAAGIEALLPLWQQSRRQLVISMIDDGIETIIVSCNDILGPEFLGRTITKTLIKELEDKNVDVCGENGEYHTLVVNAPFFKQRLQVEIKQISKVPNYNFADMKLCENLTDDI